MGRKVKRIIKNYNINWHNIHWMYQISAPYRKSILGLILLKCIMVAIGIAMAAVNKYIVDLASSSLNMTGNIILAVFLTALSLIGGILLGVWSVKLTEQYSYHIRNQMYQHILRSTWKARVTQHSEEMLSRLTSDVNMVTSGIVNVSIAIVSTIVQLIMAFFLLWHYDWTLALFALITGPVAAIVSIYFGRKLKKVQKNLQQTEADYRVYLQEQISNADVIKAFEKEAESINKLDELQKKRMYWVEQKNKWKVLMGTGISFVFSGTYLFAFITAALKIAAGVITYGTMTAFLSLVNQIQTPIYTLSSLLPQIVGVLASAGRIMEISDMPIEEDLKSENQYESMAEKAGIQAKDISFSYDGKREILSKLSFNITPGQIAVITGPSGIGKTTLIRILLGFLHCDSGELVYINENEEKIICSANTRKYISYVPQGNTLFSGTIADNLKMGYSKATLEQMQQALKIACAWEFVEKLPSGINTVIGEKANGLSEGQAQRIAIARAVIRPAPILILDEATSALDENTERNILDNLHNIKNGQTCFVVSHRNMIKEYADQVIDLKQEDGNL